MRLFENQFHLVPFFSLNAAVGHDMAATRFRFSKCLYHNHIGMDKKSQHNAMLSDWFYQYDEGEDVIHLLRSLNP
jgi:hypothetical protein